MDFVYDMPLWARGVHIACASLALALLGPAIYYGAYIKHRLVFMTPTLCLALGYENLLLVLPDRYATKSAQQFGWIMNALIPPVFLTMCFETGYVVHKHRSVKYLGINFDEGKRVNTQPCSWLLRNLVRLIALAILFMGLMVNFNGGIFPAMSNNAGMSGFLGLGRPDRAHYYVSLVPSLVFSLVSIVISATIAKYGIHSTLLIRRSLGWYYMLIGAVLQCAGQFPAQTDVYPATSMLGQTLFLLCAVLAHRTVLRDLLEAARITEFLRRQKAVQIQLAATSMLREGALRSGMGMGIGAGGRGPQGQGGVKPPPAGGGGGTTVSLPASLVVTPVAGADGGGAAWDEGGGRGSQRRRRSSGESLPPHHHGHRHHHHHHHHHHHRHLGPTTLAAGGGGGEGEDDDAMVALSCSPQARRPTTTTTGGGGGMFERQQARAQAAADMAVTSLQQQQPPGGGGGNGSGGGNGRADDLQRMEDGAAVSMQQGDGRTRIR